jgi:putative radical SAM enzyme (TIGR03279 family)
MAIIVSSVEPDSPAARAGVQVGDELLKIGSEPIHDVLDYRFFMLQERFFLTLRRAGKMMSLPIRKQEDEDLGLSFPTYLMDDQKSCRNKCVFCFIDQNPSGMRDSIYFKDDDSRLSFLFGNYITLTNLTDEDIERILRLHISPINVSVHTTNPELRVRMMTNRFAGEESLARLRRLCEGEIRVNTQLVLCPGYNDGKELERTLTDLGELYPALQSIACVPVGLTGHREGLTELRPFTKEEAAETIDIIERFSDKWLAERGDRIVYPADEFFLKAGRILPKAEYYGDFAQLENGVGLITNCHLEFDKALYSIRPCDQVRRVTIATGRAAATSIAALARKAMALDPLLSVAVCPIPSRFFGGHITVTGLVTGSDIIEELMGRYLGDALIVPSCMLRSEGDLFLDNQTPEELSEALGVPVIVSGADGGSLARTLLSPLPERK